MWCDTSWREKACNNHLLQIWPSDRRRQLLWSQFGHHQWSWPRGQRQEDQDHEVTQLESYHHKLKTTNNRDEKYWRALKNYKKRKRHLMSEVVATKSAEKMNECLRTLFSLWHCFWKSKKRLSVIFVLKVEPVSADMAPCRDSVQVLQLPTSLSSLSSLSSCFSSSNPHFTGKISSECNRDQWGVSN